MNFSLLLSRKTSPLNRRLRHLALLIVLLGNHIGTTWAQPVSWELIPGTFENEDTISIHIDIGTEGEPASNIYGFSAIYECDNFTIDPQSQLTLDIEANWLFDQDGWTGTITTNEQGDSLWVDVWRDDQVPQSGYGEVASGGNVIVIIEDYIGKTSLTSLKQVSFKALTSPNEVSLFPHPTSGEIYIGGLKKGEEGRIRLLSLAGQEYHFERLTNEANSIDLQAIPSGVYIIIIETNVRREVRKIVVAK